MLYPYVNKSNFFRIISVTLGRMVETETEKILFQMSQSLSFCVHFLKRDSLVAEGKRDLG